MPIRSRWSATSRWLCDFSRFVCSVAALGLISSHCLGFSAGGTLNGMVTWTTSDSPVQIASSLTIAPGAILTISPGVAVQLDSGVNLTIASGGQLLAEGTAEAPIRFTRKPGTTGRWGGITLNGGTGSPETRLSNVIIEFNGSTAIHSSGGTLLLDHALFNTTDHQYVSLDGSSFVISHSIFPTSSASFELLHGTGGIKAGGYGIVRHNFFGSTTGYNDIMDFTGGNRPGQPIIEYYNNVFIGGSDDILDLDGTDAWIEGNLFMHVHRNGAPDSSAAVSGGDDSGHTSEITVVGNLFFDCDNAATAKQGNFFSLINNTIVRTTREGGLDFASGIVNVRDTTPSLTTFGRGFYLEGNVITDAEQLVRNYDASQVTITFSNNILPMAWTGPGGGNRVTDAGLVHLPTLAETQFKTWEEAQTLRTWLALTTNSPAHGASAENQDLGGCIPMGVRVWGAPSGTVTQRTADLHVGFNRTGNGIPAASWTLGCGYSHYKWRLDGGAWSAETPINQVLHIEGLAAGPHYVEVTGKRDSGRYQDDPLLGDDAVFTRTATWTVSAPAPTLLQPTLNAQAWTLGFKGTPETAYALETANRLGAWTPAGTVKTDANGTGSFSGTMQAGETRFFRLRTTP